MVRCANREHQPASWPSWLRCCAPARQVNLKDVAAQAAQSSFPWAKTTRRKHPGSVTGSTTCVATPCATCRRSDPRYGTNDALKGTAGGQYTHAEQDEAVDEPAIEEPLGVPA